MTHAQQLLVIIFRHHFHELLKSCFTISKHKKVNYLQTLHFI